MDDWIWFYALLVVPLENNRQLICRIMPGRRCFSDPLDGKQMPCCKPYLLVEGNIYCNDEHLWFRLACLAN